MAKKFKNSQGGSFTSKAKGAKLISGRSGAWKVKGVPRVFLTFSSAKSRANKIAHAGSSTGSSAKRNPGPVQWGEGLTYNEFASKYRRRCKLKRRKPTQRQVAANWKRYKLGLPTKLPKQRDEESEWAAFSRKHTDPNFY